MLLISFLLLTLISYFGSSVYNDLGLYFSCMGFCRMREDGELNAYDNESASVIRLNNSTVLYLREVNR